MPPGIITMYFTSLNEDERYQATHFGPEKQWMSEGQIRELEDSLKGAVVRLDLNHKVVGLKTARR